MRGIPSLITDTRKSVFTEVARLSYEGGDYTRIEELPYKIFPGDQAVHRASIFLERAIVGERIRLAMGLPLQPVHEHTLISDNVEDSAVAEKYYDPPLINIIPFACNACPTKQYKVTESCQNCLAQSSQKVCPKGAVSTVNGKSHVDTAKCVRCGKCAGACDYNAIILLERPCQKACGRAQRASVPSGFIV
jgi:ferredoxin-like protein FixX